MQSIYLKQMKKKGFFSVLNAIVINLLVLITVVSAIVVLFEWITIVHGLTIALVIEI